MKTWYEFVEEIDQLYSKAHIAVEIVKLYNPQILNNISVISNLANGAYGVYNSGENQKIIPKNVETYLIYYGKVNRRNLDLIPKKTIMQYFPQVGNQIKESDTIHVNVKRIMQESGSDFEAIIEIASTIIHEATHEIERETTGTTSEVGPVAAEHAFVKWVESSKNLLMSKFPQLAGDVVGPKGYFPGKV
jgi:phosphatidylinositol kinase/protein kinase (PI-3  family)